MDVSVAMTFIFFLYFFVNLVNSIYEFYDFDIEDAAMPSVELSSQTFSRLQAHAIPLVDNIETVVTRLIDFYEAKDGTFVSDLDKGIAGKIRQFNPLSPPTLTHTKILAIEFCGRSLDHAQTNWNGLLNAAVREAKYKMKSAAELKQIVTIPYIDGKKTDEGFRYLSDLGISIQGQDANGAWKAAFYIARKLDLSLSVTFVWREKEGAAFPGSTGQLSTSSR